MGRNAEHQYIATGFAGNGMTFGTLGAMMAADGILGRMNPWSKDYPYYLIRDRFAGVEGRTLRSVKRGVAEARGADGHPEFTKK